MGQKLGQHFLKNEGAIVRIIEALDLRRGETVIEIGPGKGALTVPLAEACARVGCALVAIEKDPLLVRKLKSSKVLKLDGFDVVEGDALRELPQLLSTFHFPLSTLKVVGNIPYYITGALLRVIGELPHRPACTVLMVQREVAERVTAKPPHMNLLAAATQVWADASLLFTLPPEDFDPPPKVESAVIRLQATGDKGQGTRSSELKNYYRFIHLAFTQPRKTLFNNLSDDGSRMTEDGRRRIGDRESLFALLQKFGYTEKTRAQELGIDQLFALSKIF